MDEGAGSDPRPAEGELLSRLRRGDGAAFEELVRGFSPRLLGVIGRVLRHEQDAQDALQETFLSAFAGLGRFDGRSQLGTWLHRIAVNAALMKLRTRKRMPEQPIEELLPAFRADGHRERPGPAWKVRADDVAELAETRSLVQQCIDKLPDSYRVVLVLRDIEQLDTAAVAESLGIDPGAVRTRLHRARQALRTLLDPHFYQSKSGR